MSCKLSPREAISIKFETLFWGEKSEKKINLSSAESAQRVVNVKMRYNSYKLSGNLRFLISRETT